MGDVPDQTALKALIDVRAEGAQEERERLKGMVGELPRYDARLDSPMQTYDDGEWLRRDHVLDTLDQSAASRPGG